jgi:hypothetical protein
MDYVKEGKGGDGNVKLAIGYGPLVELGYETTDPDFRSAKGSLGDDGITNARTKVEKVIQCFLGCEQLDERDSLE